MTREEGDRIDTLTTVVMGLITEVRTNNVASALQIEHMKFLCNERHNASTERVAHLERSERQTYGLRHKLQGMTAPAAVFVAVVALLVQFVR